MKIIQLGLVGMLMGSWNSAPAMQIAQYPEIVVARAKTLLELGKVLVERKEYEEAREYLEEAATQGMDEVSAVGARVRLGELYYGGFGVEIDYEKAHECFVQVAHQKEDLYALVVACQYLGEMYLLGLGVEKNYQKAGMYFQVLNKPEIKEEGSVLSSVALKQWRLIEPQLVQLYAITHDEVNAVQLRKEIIAEYGKLDAKSLIELIHALDYADIPSLLEIACDEVKKSDLGRFNFEQIISLPGDMGNRIILDKILRLTGPMFAKAFATCRGHKDWVDSVCITNDRKIVSGSYDKTIRVWDIQGKEVAICRGHEERVISVCVANNGNIVSGSFDKTIRVWDMRGKELARCRGHEDLVYSVCVTNDGKIVSGSNDKTIRMWDMQGKEFAICTGHEGGVTSVCVTNDGKIVSGSKDKTIRVWDMLGKEVALCRGHKDSVYSVCITHDGKIVSCSKDLTVRVWDMQGKELALCRGHKDWINSVCIANDGKIVSGSNDKTIRVWDTQGNQLAICRGHESSVYSVCVTKDGNIVSGSPDKTVRVWDIRLLGRIVRMNQVQAQALWELLHSISKGVKIGKPELWKEIEKILGEDLQVAHAKINNNNNE